MGLTRLALHRPLAILMLILGVVLMGVVAYSRLKVDRLPAITIPFVSVSVNYPGAAPEDVEAQIVTQLEEALIGISGAETMSASAREGSGSVNLQFAEGTDLDKAFAEVQQRVARVAPQLPRDASDPRVSKFDPNSSPIMNLVLSGGDSQQLFKFAEDVVSPKLLSLPGVADLDVSGGDQRVIQIKLDLGQMTGRGVSVDQVTGALGRENISVPSGSLDRGRSSLTVRSVGLIQNIDDLGNLIVATGRNGQPIYLKNVATISDTFRTRTRYLRYNGLDAVGVSVLKQGDANTIAVADSIRASVEDLRRVLPPDSQISVVNDSSRFVRRSLNAVQTDLLLGAFLTATVLLLFLHTWRNTLIVLLAIPTSLISTFLVMFIFGFSLNIMTLMALAMTIGILVDDSIVVLENIHRHLGAGEKPMDAALSGRSEIGLAAMAITFTDVVVYMPIAFMQGNIGQLFREYGLTVATATLFSLIVSFTLTPMLASRWLKAHPGNESGERADEAHGNVFARGWGRFTNWWETGFERLANRYGRTLNWAIHHRIPIVGLGFVALAASVAMLPLNILGTEYAPQEDDGQFRVDLNMPVGTSTIATNEAALQLEGLLMNMHDVKSVNASVGGNGANFTIETEEKMHRSKTLTQMMDEVRQLGRQVPEATVRASVQNPLSGGRNGISIQLLGEDVATLNQLANQVVEIAEKTPGISDASSSFQSQQQELRFNIDRNRANALGINVSQVANSLRTIVQGSSVGQLKPEGEAAVNVTVEGNNVQTMSPAALANVPITYSAKAGIITLGQVATSRTGSGPVSINRQDRKRSLSVNATVSGRSVGDVARDLKANLGALPLPPGYRWEVRGQVQQLENSFTALKSALLLSVILIYMLLVALYESPLYPLAIMFSLPVSLVGALGGLWITGNTLNIFSMMGMVALMGLVAKNAILLVDYTNTLRARGLLRGDAIVEAGRARLRPILMTSSTIVAAMLPLAFKFEAGAESRAPMAVVIIGGVISSTLLTLVLVPVVYTYLDDFQERFNIPATFKWPWQQRSAVPQPVMAAPAQAAPVMRSAEIVDG